MTTPLSYHSDVNSSGLIKTFMNQAPFVHSLSHLPSPQISQNIFQNTIQKFPSEEKESIPLIVHCWTCKGDNNFNIREIDSSNRCAAYLQNKYFFSPISCQFCKEVKYIGIPLGFQFCESTPSKSSGNIGEVPINEQNDEGAQDLNEENFLDVASNNYPVPLFDECIDVDEFINREKNFFAVENANIRQPNAISYEEKQITETDGRITRDNRGTVGGWSPSAFTQEFGQSETRAENAISKDHAGKTNEQTRETNTSLKPKSKRGRKPIPFSGICEHCSTIETPEWRRGPTGPKKLCNKCGLQYSKAKKNRTARKKEITNMRQELDLLCGTKETNAKPKQKKTGNPKKRMKIVKT
jgi:hypothetical protein